MYPFQFYGFNLLVSSYLLAIIVSFAQNSHAGEDELLPVLVASHVQPARDSESFFKSQGWGLGESGQATCGIVQLHETLDHNDSSATCFDQPTSWYRFDKLLCQGWSDGTLFTHGNAGISYFDVPGESKFGGYEGLAGGFDLGHEFLFLGNFYANHVARGSQYYGTIGVFRGPRYWHEGLHNQLGASLIFGQFSDSRFDSVSLSQLRVSVDCSISAQSQIGFGYIEPLTNDRITSDNDFFELASLRDIRTSRRFGGHVKARVGEVRFRADIGYRVKSRSVLLGASANMAFNERFRAVTTLRYQDQGVWVGIVGLQYAFGPRRQMERQHFRGIQLPDDAIKINNDLAETPALLEADQARWELFEEGVGSLSE